MLSQPAGKTFCVIDAAALAGHSGDIDTSMTAPIRFVSFRTDSDMPESSAVA
jgi:hypothetical protein